MKAIFTLFFLLFTLSLFSVNTISVSGSPSVLSVNSAIAGVTPLPVTNTQTSCSINVDVGTGRTITAHLDSELTSGAILKVSMEAPSGAISSGSVQMSSVAKNLVTSIDQGAFSNLLITYTLISNLALPSTVVKTVIFTLN